MTPSRFTSLWLVGQFLLLVVLFHAGPWPWASRSLSMLAALIPAWALLAMAGWDEHEFTFAGMLVISFVAGVAAGLNIAAVPGSEPGAFVVAYRVYAWTYVLAQCLLVCGWLAWWRKSDILAAFGGVLIAAIGAVISSWVHGMRPIDDILAMHPWAYMWSGEHGPIDVISRVAPELVTVEVGVLGGASVVLAAMAWRKG